MRTRRAITAAVTVAIALTAAPAFSEEKSPIATGKAVFELKCVTCHTLERPLAKKADHAGWQAILKDMIARGAKLEPAEVDQVLGYLSAKSAFEARCNACHELERPLTAIKNPDAWKATVVRMAAMKPGAITDAEAGAITLYLSLVTPVAKK